jgi:hypothetical protein
MLPTKVSKYQINETKGTVTLWYDLVQKKYRLNNSKPSSCRIHHILSQSTQLRYFFMLIYNENIERDILLAHSAIFFAFCLFAIPVPGN